VYVRVAATTGLGTPPMVFSINGSKPATNVTPGVPTGNDSDMVSKKEKLAVFCENSAKWRRYSKKFTKISTIPAEDGGDQTSITKTSRPEITQGHFEGLCLSKLHLDVVQEFLSFLDISNLFSHLQPHNLLTLCRFLRSQLKLRSCSTNNI
jgi:hypothetical protein